MDLYEYEAKQEFRKHDIPIPKGILITDASQTAQAAMQLNPPYIVKAQVLAGGRGKAGGILPAQSAQQAQQVAARLFAAQIKGFPVKRVLVEEKLAVTREIYVSIAIDRFNRCYVMLASQAGGVNIEETAAKTPKAILSKQVDWLVGFGKNDAAEIVKKLGYSGKQQAELAEIIQKLYSLCVDNDAELVEINPLAETPAGFVALDARMVIDDNALFRHPEYAERKAQQLSKKEAFAAEQHLAYVELDGDIGVVGNGAGLVMATLDLLNLSGGKPADFLDLGGGATVEAITAALQIVSAAPKVLVVLVNVLGGITHCDDVARGIVSAIRLAESKKPLVVRLVGTNQREGKRILKDAGFSVLDSMEQAAEKAVKLAEEQKNGHNH